MELSSGKWVIVVGAALAAAAACYTPSPPDGVTPVRGVRPETEQVNAQPGAAPTEAATPALAGKTVSAGMKTEFFTPYSITVAPGWVDTHESDASAPRDVLTLTKGDYILVIAQAGMGIEACFFGGAPTPTGAAQLWQEYASGVEIRAGDTVYMRGTNDGMTHALCVKRDGGYVSVMSMGAITYTTPSPADEATLAEMDGMIVSLIK